MADPLMGLSQVPAAWPIIFFTSLAPGSYSTWYRPDPIGFPLAWLSAGSILVSSNGTYNTFGFSSAIAATTRDYTVTTGSAPNPANPGANLESYTMGFDGASAVNPYLLSDPALTAAPANTLVALSWTAPTLAAADSRAELIYAVRRGTATPPTTVVASGVTVQLYDSTGLTNGTTYYHRIAADLRIVGSTTGMSVARLSNITATIPAVQPLREAWGTIAI